MDNCDLPYRQNRPIGAEIPVLMLEQARSAVQILSENGVHMTTLQIEALCRPDSLSAIEKLTECSPKLRTMALQDLKLPIKSADTDDQLHWIDVSTVTPSRAISASSNTSRLSGSTLNPSSSTRTRRSQYQSENASPLQGRHFRHSQDYSIRPQHPSPNPSAYEDFSQEFNFPMQLSQHEGAVVLSDPFSNGTAIDFSSIPQILTPYHRQSPSAGRNVSGPDHQRFCASSTIFKPQQEPSLCNNRENPELFLQSHNSGRIRRIKRKPVGSGPRIEPPLAPTLISPNFNEEYPQVAASKAKRPEAPCHLCSKESRSYQLKREFENHLEAVHAQRAKYLCKHSVCHQFETFRSSEWTKHHTRIHSPRCLENGTERAWCYEQRANTSGYLRSQCPKCSKISGNHAEWIQHHLDHFSHTLHSLANNTHNPIFEVICIDTQKRARGSRSQSSSPPSVDGQPSRYPVKKSPRTSQEYVRFDVNKAHTNQSKDGSVYSPNFSFENNDLPHGLSQEPLAFDSMWHPGFPFFQ